MRGAKSNTYKDRWGSVLSFCGILGVVLMSGFSVVTERAWAKSDGPTQAQIMLGGSKYFVKGKLINIQGDYYWIRTSNGDKIRLRVSHDTNMFCESPVNGQKNPDVTGSGKAPHTSKGFRIGDCPPEPGQYIKAEVDDLGKASYLRTMGPGKMPTTTERLGLPQDYFILPVVKGVLMASDAIDSKVQSSDGVTIGSLEKIILDSKKGEIAYAIVALNQGSITTNGMEVAEGSLMPVPWELVENGRTGDPVTLDVTGAQLARIPTFGRDMSVMDVRAYWELSEETETQPAEFLESREYHGSDRVAELELAAARAQFEAARDRYLNSKTLYQSDLEAMERARKSWADAVHKFRFDSDKTIQQELQKQIFR